MDDEKRKVGTYEIEQSLFIGDKEVLFGVDKTQEYPFMVCYCDYNNPLSTPWPTEAVGTDDYLEAMRIFTDRVQSQVELTRAEQENFRFDKTPFTVKDCIPDKRNESIVGKVVVINAERSGMNTSTPPISLCWRTAATGLWAAEVRLCSALADWAKEALAQTQTQEKAKKPKHKDKER